MTLNELELTELIVARFCHDIAGPIGAISNGVEFLKEENVEMRDKAYQLVEISAKQAVTRLQFFRQLYGTTPSVGEANLGELKILTENYLVGSKITLDWTDENMVMHGDFISHRLGKSILNVINICTHSLIYGGKIEVKLNKLPNGKQINVNGYGTSPKLDNEAIKLLNNQYEDIVINTKNIHFVLTMQILEKCGATLTIDRSDEQINFIIQQIKD